ncbi:hypothetical protein [Nonomuraea rubra]|uniref:hypothetical protein n=1 Tax=Nonomuraea rubra TaxID=46180 RepID=UPI0031E5E637
MSETAYELGVALGIAVLGSLQTPLPAHLDLPGGLPEDVRAASTTRSPPVPRSRAGRRQAG